MFRDKGNDRWWAVLHYVCVGESPRVRKISVPEKKAVKFWNALSALKDWVGVKIFFFFKKNIFINIKSPQNRNTISMNALIEWPLIIMVPNKYQKEHWEKVIFANASHKLQPVLVKHWLLTWLSTWVGDRV